MHNVLLKYKIPPTLLFLLIAVAVLFLFSRFAEEVQTEQVRILRSWFKSIQKYSSDSGLKLRVLKNKEQALINWVSDEGYGVVVPVTSAVYLYNNLETFESITKEQLADLTQETTRALEGISFTINEVNTSTSTNISGDKVFGGFVKLAFKNADGTLLCVMETGEGYTYPTWSLQCITKEDLATAYETQLPFIQAFGYPKGVFILPYQIGNYARVGVSDGFTGYFAIMKKINGEWTVIYRGQDDPLCDLMRQNNIPILIYKRCIEKEVHEDKRNLNQSGTANSAETTATTLWGTPVFPVDESDLAPTPQGWKIYSYGNFNVAFPEEPSIVDQSSSEVKIITYRAGQEDGTQYFLSVTNFPNNFVQISDKSLLESAVQVTVLNLRGELHGAIDTRNATGYDSIDYVISIADGPRTYMGRGYFGGFHRRQRLRDNDVLYPPRPLRKHQCCYKFFWYSNTGGGLLSFWDTENQFGE